MFRIYLFGPDHKSLTCISSEGNERYLPQEGVPFSLLSNVSLYDECVFASRDMTELEDELRLLVPNLAPAEISHVEAIIDLARRCAALEGSYLVFTPYAPVPRDAQGRPIPTHGGSR